jgi:hypothetical protein
MHRLPRGAQRCVPLIIGVILAILSSSGWAQAAAAPCSAVSHGIAGRAAASTRLVTHPLNRAALVRTVLVRPGDTLSGIAARHCGNPRDWTGIYLASRRVIGADPNMIRPGQLVVLHCTSPRWNAPTAVQGDREPDGDSDDATARSTAVYSSPGYAASGTYSYGGLETLWVSAGGPSWAAAHAAEIAMCESGGRTWAYNPSGATGLWQILGAVVAGNLYNAYTNALNAVAKFHAGGGPGSRDTFAQWVCT